MQARWRPLAFAVLIWLPQHHAWADLMLYPTRIVFENKQRAAQLELINNGTETATYRISVVNRRMSDTGEFSMVDQPLPGEQFSAELLRYSPRQVVLAPGAGQTVRVSLRKPVDLAPGEYRSHLQFERIPEAGAGNRLDGAGPNQASGEVGVQLKALIGVSIPVIVRHGDTAAKVTLSGLDLRQPADGQAATLAFVLQRSGNRSVYGDVDVSFTPLGGAAQEVGKADGVAVYSPNPLRRIALALRPPAGLALVRGTLRVAFRERPDAGGKLLAEEAIELR